MHGISLQIDLSMGGLPSHTHLTQEASLPFLFLLLFLVVLGARQELFEELGLLGESWYEKYIWFQYDLALILSK
jgi:hypothetical protein